MRGLGTIVNVVAIVAGTLVGLAGGSRVPDRMRTTVLQGLGLSVIALGVHDSLATHNLVFPIVSLVVGAVVGEALSIEERLESVGERIRRRVQRARAADEAGHHESTFVEGFVSASLLFCVGPLAILGSISDGLGRGSQELIVKSALSVGVLQGTITALAGVVENVLSERMVAEMTATGGIIIMGIGARVLELRKVRVGSFLPALVIAPVAVALFAR